jgi:hypothetical protein
LTQIEPKVLLKQLPWHKPNWEMLLSSNITSSKNS